MVSKKSKHGWRVMIVEDEPSQMEMLEYNLKTDGYQVVKAVSGDDALILVKEQEIDLILLDWMLPDTSGIEVCRTLKKSKKTRSIPIIMLTARGEEDDKVRGLDTGADDFVVKPYSVKELLARVRAALRRNNESSNGDKLRYSDVEMDLSRHKLYVSGTEVVIGPTEFKLLRTFLEQPERVWSREQLLDRVWNETLDIETRTVDVHVGRVRKALSNIGGRDYIRTIRGFGYSLEALP